MQSNGGRAKITLIYSCPGRVSCRDTPDPNCPLLYLRSTYRNYRMVIMTHSALVTFLALLLAVGKSHQGEQKHAKMLLPCLFVRILGCCRVRSSRNGKRKAKKLESVMISTCQLSIAFWSNIFVNEVAVIASSGMLGVSPLHSYSNCCWRPG